MRHRRNTLALLRLDLVRHHHEWRWVVRLEILAHPLRQNRRTERPEGLAILDAAVENLFHVLEARVCKNASVPQRARAELHAALKPAHNLPLGNRLHRAVDQILLRELVILASGRLQVAEDLTDRKSVV